MLYQEFEFNHKEIEQVKTALLHRIELLGFMHRRRFADRKTEIKATAEAYAISIERIPHVNPALTKARVLNDPYALLDDKRRLSALIDL